MISKLIKQILRRKLTIGIALLIIGTGAYFMRDNIGGNNSAVQYVVETAERGTLVSSLSGSGQVLVSDQVDIKPSTSGDVVWVGVQTGQKVRQWATLFTLDDTDAQKAVRDAELDLEESKLKLEQDIAQAPIDYERKLESLQKAKDDLENEYEDAFNTISSAFLDLPPVMTGLSDILLDETVSGGFANQDAYKNLFSPGLDRDFVTLFITSAERDFLAARSAHDSSFLQFKDLSRSSDDSVVEGLLGSSLDTAKLMGQAAHSENNMLDAIIDTLDKNNRKPSFVITAYKSDLKGYIGTLNSKISSLNTQQRSLADAKGDITNIERDISVFEVGNTSGINPINLQIARNSIAKKEFNLADLKAKLADYVVRAPFSGVVARVNARRGDSVSAGTTLATLITQAKITEIALNEIDIALVAIDQLVTLTFDAVEDITLTGNVFEIDALGTVSQGVVTYNVRIAFDTQDERIKPGMTANAAIITDRKDGIVLVPNSAVQSRGGQVYVDVMQDGLPRSVVVEVGLSNELSTEIISGLKPGAQVVTARLGGEASSQTTNIGQSFRGGGIPGLGGSSSGGFRGGGFPPH